MSSVRACVVSVCVIALTLAYGSALAQPAVEKPTYKVGDRWQFTSTEGDKTSTWSREIVEVRTDGLVVKFGNGTINAYDDAMNFVDAEGPANSRILGRYPLRVGAEWQYTRKAGQKGALDERGSAKVVAYEKATVPAGTYDCYRVETEASITGRLFNEKRTWTRWYCPGIRWIAKERMEVQTFNPRGPPTNTTSVSELVKFTPGS
jgi:hypothetical protein